MSYPEFESRKELRTPQQLKQDAWRLVDLFPPPLIRNQQDERDIEDRLREHGLEAYFPRARLSSMLSLEIQDALASILEEGAYLTRHGEKRILRDFEKHYLLGLDPGQIAQEDYAGFPVLYFGRRNDDTNLGVLDSATAVVIDRRFFQEEEQRVITRVLNSPLPSEVLEDLLARVDKNDMQAMLRLAFSDYGALQDLKKEFISIHHVEP